MARCGLAANFLMLAMFRGLSDRYANDYFPTALLLGGMGALALAAGRPDLRRFLAPAARGAGRRSILGGTAAILGLDGRGAGGSPCRLPARDRR